MAVYLIATLDTKGPETAFLRDQLRSHGVEVRVMDVGCLGEPAFRPDVARGEVFAAGEVDSATDTLGALQAAHDRGRAVAMAARGAAALASQLHARREVSGVLGLGGSAGTTIATAGMRALPLGIPKLMISTLASGQVRPWVGDKDILMLNSIVDLAGLNRVSRIVLAAGARAMAGMVSLNKGAAPNGTSPAPDSPATADRPVIAATMFGVTTPCVQEARHVLEEAGYEVLVFHATGAGGQAMESLVDDGLIAGVLDITTTELADEIVGGVLSAGPDRLRAAGRRGIPQVISVGATDMVNFGPRETVPPQFAGRCLYEHNPAVTLMRTTEEECRAIGRDIGQKAAAARGPVAILLPSRGVSAIDAVGQPFDDRPARLALFEAIRAHSGTVPVEERDEHLNDRSFARAAAERLLNLLSVSPAPERR
jgi:uncharacterized protein (UPF0261 family)